MNVMLPAGATLKRAPEEAPTIRLPQGAVLKTGGENVQPAPQTVDLAPQPAPPISLPAGASRLREIGTPSPLTIGGGQVQGQSSDQSTPFYLGGASTNPQPDDGHDSWMTLGAKVVQNAPDMIQQSVGGLLRGIGEMPLAAPVPGAESWPEFQKEQAVHQERVAAPGGLDDLGARIYGDASTELAANAPNVDPNSLKRYAYDITQGIVQMGPMLAASMATKSPAIGLSMMAGQVGGQEYGQSRADGRTPAQSAGDAGFYALAETIPETIPLGILMKPGQRFLTRTLKSAGAEGVQEMFTQILQTGYDAGVIGEDMTWGEAIRQVIDAGIVGTGVGGGLAVASHPFAGAGEAAPVEAPLQPEIPLQVQTSPAAQPDAPAGVEPPPFPNEPLQIAPESIAVEPTDDVVLPEGAVLADTIIPAPPVEDVPQIEANTTRPELSALLDDPRPLAEIKAEHEAAQNWTPTADWQDVPVGAQVGPDIEVRETDAGQQARVAPPQGSREAPVALDTPEAVNLGAERTVEPTPAQAKAGNYPKRHLKWNGLDLTIETEAGQERTGIDPSGKPWSVTMPAPYGYVKRTEGADGDHIDIYVGPQPASPSVFIVDQIEPQTKGHDEHKVMLGYPDAKTAMENYHAAFSDGSGPQRVGAITQMTVQEFKGWLANADTTKPLSYEKPVEPEAPAVLPHEARADINRLVLSTKKPINPAIIAKRLKVDEALVRRHLLNMATSESSPIRAKTTLEGKSTFVRKPKLGPLSLMQFIASKGGLRDEAGELKARDLDKKFLPGFGKLVRPNGLSFDDARELAEEAGYIRSSQLNSTSSINDFLDALDTEIRGTKVHAAEDIHEVADRESVRVADEMRDRYGDGAKEIKALAKEHGIVLDDDTALYAAYLVEAERMSEAGAITIAFGETAISYADNLAMSAQGFGLTDGREIPFSEYSELDANEAQNRETVPRDEQGQEIRDEAPRDEPRAEPVARQEPAQPSSVPAGIETGAAPESPPVRAEPRPDQRNERGAGEEVTPDKGQPQRTASWILKDKTTGEVVMETFDRKKVDALNTDKYVAVPIQEHLASLNAPKAEPTVEKTEAGQQTVISGAEKISDKSLAERKMAGGKRAAVAQKPADDGLFDTGARKQGDLLDAVKAAPEPNAESTPVPQQDHAPREDAAPKAAASIKSLSDLDAIASRVGDGDMTADEARALFDQTVAAKEALVADLGSKTKAQLQKYVGARYQNERKDKMVKAAFDELLSTFHVKGGFSWSPFTETYEDALKRAVGAQTDADFKAYADRLAARKAEVQQTLTDPQTIPQFETFIRTRGRAKLTAEQRARYDDLVAEATRAAAERGKAASATIKKVETDATMKMVETKHTKKGHDLFVVQMSDRVSPEKYKELSSASKKLGGYYSSYAKDGAVPGFQFVTKDAAEKFMALQEGDVSRLDEMEAHDERIKGNVIERLRAMAERMGETADASLNSDRKVNTDRRARMAAGAEARAEADKAMAATMLNLADAIADGNVRNLEGIRSRQDIETLDSLLRRARVEWAREEQKTTGKRFEELKDTPITPEMVDKASYPWPYAHRETAMTIATAVENTNGLKRMAIALKKAAKDAEKRGDWRVVGGSIGAREMLKETATGALKNDRVKWEAKTVLDGFDDFNRVQRMGLTNPASMRAALREFLEYRGSAKKADPLKAAERALIGRKIAGYFPTPKALAERVVDEADIRAGMSVLEPSAGKGSIAEAAAEAADEGSLSVIEPVSDLRSILELKGFNIVDRDFLGHETTYDRIVMNPPFEDRQDVAHVRHAYDLLKPGGRVVAIMSEGPFFGSDKRATEFRDWLDEVGGVSEQLPEGSFKDSDRSTGVATRLVVIDKNRGVAMLKRSEPAPASPQVDGPVTETRSILTSKFADEAKSIYPAMRERLDKIGLKKVGLKLVDKIEAWVNGQVSSADGMFDEKLITVALERGYTEHILNHEALHGLRRLGLFTDAEWSILTQKSNAKWREQYDIDNAYAPFPEWAKIEEGVAYAYGEWATGNAKFDGRIVRLFKRIADFFDALKNALNGKGFTSAGQIFERIERGEMATRAEAKTGNEKPMFSLTEQPKTSVERTDVMQGFIGRGQPIDRALRIPFDIFGGVDTQGRWKPGVALFDKASKIITEAKFDAKGRFAFANPVMEVARRGLVDRYGLSDEYVTRDRDRALDERAVMMQGTEVLKTLRDHAVGPEEAKVLQAILTGEAVDDVAMQKLAEPIRKSIDLMGQEAVELGLLSAESFERNRGAYLHRVYLKNEADQDGLTKTLSSMMGKRRKKIIGEQFKGRGMFMEVLPVRLMKDVPEFAKGEVGIPPKGEKFRILDEYAHQSEMDVGEGGKPKPVRRVYWPEGKAVPARYADFTDNGVWEIRGKKGGLLVLWRDFTKPERSKMGEIMDARYTITKTYMLMAHDLATGKFYKDIATHPEWASSEAPNEKWIDAAEWARTGQRFIKRDGVEWVKVPSTELAGTGGKLRWGALSGKYVREEIWRDINELEVLSRPNVWRTLLSQWKLNKTARSPVVHMNNVVSNFLFMDMADVRMQDLHAGVKAFAEGEGNADYDEAFANGAFGGDAMTQEIRNNILKPLLDEMTATAEAVSTDPKSRIDALGMVAQKIFGYAKWADEKMIDAYRMEDEIFRMASYMRRRSLGDTPKQAADFARQQFIDYDIRAPWVNMARNSVLPFISYTYRAAPLVAKAMAHHPWKLAKYAMIAQAVNMLGYMLTGDDDEDRERRSLRDTEQGSTWVGAPRMIRMPFNDQYGNPTFLDVRRWIPAGDIFDTQGNDIPAWLNLGGPLLLGAELFLNRSGFTGDDITNTEINDFWERSADRGSYLWKAWMPSAAWVPYSWYWDKIANAIYGATDYSGRPYGIGNSVASSIGIKLKPQDVEDGMSWKAFEFSKTERALKAEAKRISKRHERGILSDKEFNQRMMKIMEKVEALNEKRKETLKP